MTVQTRRRVRDIPIGWATVLAAAVPVAIVGAIAAWPSSSEPKVVIESPASGSKVQHRTVVTGTATNLKDGQRVMIADYATGAARVYFSSASPVAVGLDGAFEAPVFLGRPRQDRGGRYRILAVLVDDRAMAAIRARPAGKGFETLPPGARVVAEVVVTRR